MPTPSHHVELADDMAVIATSRKPTMLFGYLESCLNDLQRWLSEWRIECLEAQLDNLRAGRLALHRNLTSNTFRGSDPMGRHNSLSGSDSRYMFHLVASHRSVQKENFSKDGYAGSPPEQEKRYLHQERSPVI